jgi:hypothetical protein
MTWLERAYEGSTLREPDAAEQVVEAGGGAEGIQAGFGKSGGQTGGIRANVGQRRPTLNWQPPEVAEIVEESEPAPGLWDTMIGRPN